MRLGLCLEWYIVIVMVSSLLSVHYVCHFLFENFLRVNHKNCFLTVLGNL